MRTKVLLCGPPLTAVGGGPTHIRSLLASSLTDRYELIHFETGSRGAESPAKEEAAFRKLARILGSPFALAGAIVTSRATVVHLNSVLDHKAFWRDLLYALVGKIFGCRVVMQMHGGSLPDLCRFRGLRALIRRGLAVPDAIILLATQERRDFAAQGITEQLYVIPNGVDVRMYRGRGERRHSGRVQRLVYMGRLVRTKGVFEAIDAVNLLALNPAFADMELRIAGSGPARDEIAAYIDARGLAGRVTLLGPLHGQAKVEFLRNADVFVFPTYHREGLPYCLLESLAAGTPVITTRVAGIPDVVVDGVHGRLIEPKDPARIAAVLCELAASGSTLQRMSRECAARAADAFSLDRLASRLDAVYAKPAAPGGMAGAASN